MAAAAILVSLAQLSPALATHPDGLGTRTAARDERGNEVPLPPPGTANVEVDKPVLPAEAREVTAWDERGNEVSLPPPGTANVEVGKPVRPVCQSSIGE